MYIFFGQLKDSKRNPANYHIDTSFLFAYTK